jgi:acetylglutamate kinase
MADLKIERKIELQDIVRQLNEQLTDEMYVLDAYYPTTKFADIAYAEYTITIKSENINADTAAAQLAVALHAEKLILLTDIRGLLRDPHDEETLINMVHTYDVPKLIEEGVISGGMIPKMECCVDAIHGGVDRVHILDGRIPHSILIELLSDKGIGTMMIHEEGD